MEVAWSLAVFTNSQHGSCVCVHVCEHVLVATGRKLHVTHFVLTYPLRTLRKNSAHAVGTGGTVGTTTKEPVFAH